MANFRESKQRTAAPLHPKQQDLPATMAQPTPTPGTTKGKILTKKSTRKTDPLVVKKKTTRKTNPSFNALTTDKTLNTVLFLRRGTRKQIHVMKEPKSKLTR